MSTLIPGWRSKRLLHGQLHSGVWLSGLLRQLRRVCSISLLV